MTDEQLQLLISEFNRQFDCVKQDLKSFKKDLNLIIEKMSDKIIIISEANISCSKDIEALRNWHDKKSEEIQKDIDGLGETIRTTKLNILENTEGKIKAGDLMTRLLIAGSYITGLSGLLMFLINKKF